MTTRRQRGNDTVNLAAAYLRNHGFPHAESVGAGRPGADILGIPDYAIEVKARRALNLLEDMRQAARHASNGQTPMVLVRPDGMGPATLTSWPTILRFADAVRLMTLAEPQHVGTPR